jgi:hypothetical protein
MGKQKRTLAVDFDGVLHRYSGYRDGFIDGPVHGALDFVHALLARGNTVVVFTTRKRSDVEAWLERHNFPALEVTDIKRPFWLILDDRAMPFDGHFDDALLERIVSFKPYWIDGGPAKGHA